MAPLTLGGASDSNMGVLDMGVLERAFMFVTHGARVPRCKAAPLAHNQQT